MNKQFIKDIEKLMKGEITPERIIEKITRVANALVSELFDKGQLQLDIDTLKTLCEMGMFVSAYDEKNVKLQACLYALVKSAEEMK